ncbi:acetyl-CoA synthetase [Coelomomyces lativittatus]|nr:acetyl-CoA synthetase [Coelomomyces lativittatus]KAJ1509628.1 acetyl-CoA synthetase [Coelomomyces lativittatus]
MTSSHFETTPPLVPTSSSSSSSSAQPLLPLSSIGLVPIPTEFLNHPTFKPHLTKYEEYETLYHESIHHPESFYKKLALLFVHWFQPFHTTLDTSLGLSQTRWFVGGYLNACYHCVDRHALKSPSHIAFKYVPDEPTTRWVHPNRHLPQPFLEVTYQELLDRVCQFAHGLIQLGVQPKDRVAIYMNMVPEAVYVTLFS